MTELTSISIFIVLKMLTLTFYVFLWVMPFILVLAFTYLWEDETHIRRARVISWPIFLPFLLAWIGLMWPTEKPKPFYQSPSSSLYHTIIGSYSDYKTESQKSQHPIRTELETSLIRVALVDWSPPKHFYVTLKDVKTGTIWERQYVSKHCNSAGSLKKGDEYNISIRKYTLSNRPNETFWEFENLYGAFCE